MVTLSDFGWLEGSCISVFRSQLSHSLSMNPNILISYCTLRDSAVVHHLHCVQVTESLKHQPRLKSVLTETEHFSTRVFTL